jgi:hypothetical protein
MAVTSMVGEAIFRHGSEAQRRKYLPLLAGGMGAGAFALTEPGAGSDAGATKTTAVRDGGDWVINGQKTFITSGSVARTLVVSAVTDKAKGTKGISSFIVPTDAPGFQPGRNEDKLGLRASITSQLFFNDCRVPAANLLGQEGDGFRQMLITLDGGRISIGAMALGLGQAALDASLKYSKERKTFGVPIAEHQLVKEMLSQMVSDYDAARLLWLRAGWLKNQGRRNNRETSLAASGPPPTRSRSTAATASPTSIRWAASTATARRR